MTKRSNNGRKRTSRPGNNMQTMRDDYYNDYESSSEDDE